MAGDGKLGCSACLTLLLAGALTAKAAEFCYTGSLSAIADSGAMTRAKEFCVTAKTSPDGGTCKESSPRLKTEQLGTAANCLAVQRENSEVVRLGYLCGGAKMSSRMTLVGYSNNCSRPLRLYARSSQSAFPMGEIKPNQGFFLVLTDVVQGTTLPASKPAVLLVACEANLAAGKEADCLKGKGDAASSRPSAQARARTEAEDLFADAIAKSPEKLEKDAEAFRVALARSAEAIKQRAADTERIRQSGGGSDGLGFVLGVAGGFIAAKSFDSDAVGQAVMQEVWRNSDDPTTQAMAGTFNTIQNVQRVVQGDFPTEASEAQTRAEIAQWALQEAAKYSDDPAMQQLATNFANAVATQRSQRQQGVASIPLQTPESLPHGAGTASQNNVLPPGAGCTQLEQQAQAQLNAMLRSGPGQSMVESCQTMARANRIAIQVFERCPASDIHGENLRNARLNLQRAEECVRAFYTEPQTGSTPRWTGQSSGGRPQARQEPPPQQRPRSPCEIPKPGAEGQC